MRHNIFWFDKKKNMGDLVGPWLAAKIMETAVPQHCNPQGNVALCGSIISRDIPIHWGTGQMFKSPITGNKRLFALRGPVSKELAIRGKKGNQPAVKDDILGDPGLLISRFYMPEVKPIYKLGIIPHYVDKAALNRKLNGIDLEKHGIKIIDIQQDVEPFVNDLLQCQTTISSTLHGLILSVSYGIPTRWIQLDKRIGGDNTKYFDFFLSLIPEMERRDKLVQQFFIDQRGPGLEEWQPVNYRATPTLNIPELMELPRKYDIPNGLAEKLLEAFPKNHIRGLLE